MNTSVKEGTNREGARIGKLGRIGKIVKRGGPLQAA
jgi:hypothetical protein